MHEGLKQFLKRSEFLVALVRTMRLGMREWRRLTTRLVGSPGIKSYLRSNHIRKLQLGAGPNVLKGWLNTDVCPQTREVLFLDARGPFPCEDRTFDYIFSEHLIEHLTYNEGLSMLRECYRVLKPGGRIRIATPSLETLIALYTPEKSDLQRRYIKWTIDTSLPAIKAYRETFVINKAFQRGLGWGHQFIYDFATLQSAWKRWGSLISFALRQEKVRTKFFEGLSPTARPLAMRI